jgi:hypothetical protein
VAAQKKSLYASERDTERVQQARAADQEEIAALDPNASSSSMNQASTSP